MHNYKSRYVATSRKGKTAIKKPGRPKKLTSEFASPLKLKASKSPKSSFKLNKTTPSNSSHKQQEAKRGPNHYKSKLRVGPAKSGDVEDLAPLSPEMALVLHDHCYSSETMPSAATEHRDAGHNEKPQNQTHSSRYNVKLVL